MIGGGSNCFIRLINDLGKVEENLKTVIIIYQFGDTSGSENLLLLNTKEDILKDVFEITHTHTHTHTHTQ